MLASPSGKFLKQYSFCAKVWTVIFLGIDSRNSYNFGNVFHRKNVVIAERWGRQCFDIVADILAVWQCNRMQVSTFIFVQLNDLKNCLIAVWSPFLVHRQQVSNRQFLSQTSLESFCVSSSLFQILSLCQLPSLLLGRLLAPLFLSLQNYIITKGGNLRQDQLPRECDYLLRVLEFMAIILL